MPSTYSPNLAIELIGTGDQAGSWGSSTNTNLGTLIEQAISGYATQAIADGADTVITIPNGASGVARNMFIECTGTLTAARNLVVPANRKLYFIFNNTTGGFAVTVKVSGLTGISVPNGKKMVLVSNGTDIFVATNYLNGQLDGSITSPTTAVTQAPGVNTTQVATTAFVQTALQLLHPVGSIYTSTSATNPGTAFGFGTWVAFGAGRVLIGNGGGFSAGATGGSADAIVVSHSHTFSGTTSGVGGHVHEASSSGGQFVVDVGSGGSYAYGGFGPNMVTNIQTSSQGAHDHTYSGTTASAGSSSLNANLQPYVVVYMWTRTA
jgi:hypothetical protein